MTRINYGAVDLPWSKSSLGGLGAALGLSPLQASSDFRIMLGKLCALRRVDLENVTTPLRCEGPNVFRTKKFRLTLYPHTGEKMMTDFLIVGKLLTQIYLCL